MGHLVGKDIYKNLGKKIDGLTIRTPWNPAFYDILKELYTPLEAEVIVKMPFGLSNFQTIEKATRLDPDSLKKCLDGMGEKGLVIDIWANNDTHYMPSPLAIGIFEFTMMRTGEGLDSKGWSHLFHEYMMGDGSVYAENFGNGQMSLMRTLPHEETIKNQPHVEVLDYEKAAYIINASNNFAIGLCSCRHEKMHLNKKLCDSPMDTCMTFGWAADYVIRHGMAKEVSKAKALENLARSKEYGLVLNADNVRDRVTYICQCCGCCCNVLLGFNKFGYENVVVTSSFIASCDDGLCSGCKKCAKACPINAIKMQAPDNTEEKKKLPVIDTSICMGCGVCSLTCKDKALQLAKRKQRVIHPETTFERVVLQCLERGTLQNQLFDNPQSMTHGAMRGILGAFLKLPPIKQALMSDLLRSSFLKTAATAITLQGKGWQLFL